MTISAKTRRGLVGVALVAGVVAGVDAGCGDEPVGGPVRGPLDGHCLIGGTLVAEPIGECLVPTLVSGARDGQGSGGSDVGTTLYNTDGNDESCKYDVAWTSTAIERNAPVTFDVRVQRLLDRAAATGAKLRIDASVGGGSHWASTDNVASSEPIAGRYEVGPMTFDQPGTWTVRFHLYERCWDAPDDSPRSGIAFFVSVP
jgi:hypothetical protein